MRGGDGVIFAAGSLTTRAKKPSLRILRPDSFAVKQNLSKGWYWRGKQVPRQINHINNCNATTSAAPGSPRKPTAMAVKGLIST